ncbi:zinc finger protein 271-like isoform X2 [Xenopus tropicalis]|uniref:Zinc finger protein 271-like isoform X2 n=1 Tax=Xenopus tropicalis TaxID=8364 RepID=A0A8J1JNN5_XENTR|nr:zinc finger protein 271-like isoform X2 [Xenopus tropicalis]
MELRASGTSESQNDGQFDLDLFFLDTAPMNISQHGLDPCDLMSPVLHLGSSAECYPKEGPWSVCSSNRLQGGVPTMASQGGGPSMASQGGGPPMASQGGGLTMASQRGGPTMASQGGGPHMASQSGGPTMASQGGGLPMASQGGGPPMASQSGGPTMASQGGGPTMASQEKVVQAEKGPSDNINTVIAHLQSLASETLYPRADTSTPTSSSLSSHGKLSEQPERADNRAVGGHMMCNRVELQESLGGAQYSLANVLSVFKGKSNAKKYICSDCGKSCPCHSAYIRHQRIHTGEKPYSCTECGKSFIQSSDYNNHVRSHTGEKPYSCAECGKSFSRSTYLLTHSRTHTKEKPYKCNVCSKSFGQHSHLALHLRIHSGEKPYICIECGNSFSRSSTLVKHKKSHRRKTLHVCVKRNEGEASGTWGAESGKRDIPEFPSLSGQLVVVKSENQMQSEKRNPQKLYKGAKKGFPRPIRITLDKCPVVEMRSEGQLRMLPRRHKFLRKKKLQGPPSESDICLWSSHIGGSSPSLDCGNCEVPCTGNRGSLYEGISDENTENYQPGVQTAGKYEPTGTMEPPAGAYTADYGCANSRETEAPGPFSNADIGSCGQNDGGFTSEKALEPVVRPPKAPSYICTYCGKAAPCQSAFLRHQRIHTGEKPYSCSECGKSFIQSSDYNNHLRSHTGEKPYTCAECGKGFSRSTYLVTHSRTHTKEKPYSCTECGKSFVQHSHLTIHLRIHSGEKPYPCLECGKHFSRSSTLAKHQKSHRKRNDAPFCATRGEAILCPKLSSVPGLQNPSS